MDKQVIDYRIYDKIECATVYCSKIVNGSMLLIGGNISNISIKVDQHFNWFQKLMWKWCFGINVEDYSEE
ncbi:MAG: hypothetical protein IKY26_09545 [Erysipelotrichaceae bacterium]|nr:hypothetical protein [Erysipelotrichaceae bacterium]